MREGGGKIEASQQGRPTKALCPEPNKSQNQKATENVWRIVHEPKYKEKSERPRMRLEMSPN